MGRRALWLFHHLAQGAPIDAAMLAKARVLRNKDGGAQGQRNPVQRNILAIDRVAEEPPRKHQRRYGRLEPVDDDQNANAKYQRQESGKRGANNSSGQAPRAGTRISCPSLDRLNPNGQAKPHLSGSSFANRTEGCDVQATDATPSTG